MTYESARGVQGSTPARKIERAGSLCPYTSESLPARLTAPVLTDSKRSCSKVVAVKQPTLNTTHAWT